MISQFIYRAHEIRLSGFKKCTSNRKKEEASIWSTALMLQTGKHKNDEDGNADL